MKNSTHKGMEFLGMGNRAWGRSCLAQATGRLSRYTHKGMEFPVAFNELGIDMIISIIC
ncbi:hypothetical protein [Nostoc sp.]|uniref:hypothetical protein n=1 Tax=Nostoc sp. TaxID=1180 RepID=UPI002FFBF5F7